MRETVSLTGAEQQRLVVLNRVLVGDLTAAEAADRLGAVGAAGAADVGGVSKGGRRRPGPWQPGTHPELMPSRKRWAAGGGLGANDVCGVSTIPT